MTKQDRLNDSSMLQRRIGAKTMKIDVNQGSARRGLSLLYHRVCALSQHQSPSLRHQRETDPATSPWGPRTSAARI